MAANRIIYYEKAKSAGIFLMGLASIFLAITVLILVTRTNGFISRSDCRSLAREHLDTAVGRGLVAVAEGNDEELVEQGRRVLASVKELEECDE